MDSLDMETRLMERNCAKCSTLKPFDSFYKRLGRPVGYCIPCCKTTNGAYQKANRGQYNSYQVKNYRKRRGSIIKRYGGKCACCGEDRYEFLSFDHINGGGNKRRKTVEGSRIIPYLERNNFPDGIQILCHNCNLAKGFYGFCPHERDK